MTESKTGTFIVEFDTEDAKDRVATLSAKDEKQAKEHAKKFHGATEVHDVTEVLPPEPVEFDTEAKDDDPDQDES